ncbi:hypothetical protein JTB14_031704 [Gonioctena quinquepunctata]|nr:hypothetical protein JTB14_031704 [Gonioctena quinquepunctata]
MENWIRTQRDIYYYKPHCKFNITSTIKSIFKGVPEKDDQNNNLLEKTNRKVSITRCKSENECEENRNITSAESDGKIWRRLSIKNYRKRKQQRQDEKHKPVIAAVMRTYDKGTIRRENSLWV